VSVLACRHSVIIFWRFLLRACVVLCSEAVSAHRMVREYLEWEQAMAGEKDDNPWSWVRKRLIGVRGYKPWFGHLFTKDQQEMRYRDIHADLRAVREHAEKEAKEKVKEARAGVAASGAGGTASSSKGKGRAEKERPGYADMDPMRRAHLFGVGIKAHVVSPWATHTDQDEPTRAAAAEILAAAAASQGHASGEPCSSGAQVAGGCSETIAHPASAAAGGVGKGGSKKRPALGVTSLRKAQKVACGKQKEASGKGSRGPRDRAWIRFTFCVCVCVCVGASVSLFVCSPFEAQHLQSTRCPPPKPCEDYSLSAAFLVEGWTHKGCTPVPHASHWEAVVCM